MAKETIIFREFRDTKLSTNKLGRAFMRLYYTYSPPVAEYIRKRQWAKKSIRMLLIPVVWLIRN